MKADGQYWWGKADAQSIIVSFMRTLFIVSYGFISKVVSDSEVEVTLSVRQENTPQTVNAKYLSITSLLFELAATPSEGDRVLILSPKEWCAKMLTGSEAVKGGDGYSIHACLAIPVGAVADNSIVKFIVSGTSEKLVIGAPTKDADGNTVKHTVTSDTTVTGDTSVTVGDSDNSSSFSMQVKKDFTVASEGKGSISSKQELDISSDDSIKIAGGSNGAARNGDQVKVVIPAGTVVVAVVGQATGTMNPADITLIGTIQQGSNKVKIG